MKKYYLNLVIIVWLVAAALNVQAVDVPALTVANVLQSHMVVQQGKPFKLWGNAPKGEKVEILAGWSKKNVTVVADEAGKWIGQIDVPQAKKGDFTPHTITIKNGSNTIKLADLLIGELWFCVGQSNMDMPVIEANFLGYPGVLNYKEEIANANFPAIRFYKSEAVFKNTLQENTKGTWQVCSPETVKGFSGVAYFFGRDLFLNLNIPIGLVVSAAPGASTQAFTNKKVLVGDATLKKEYFDPQIENITSQQKIDSAGFFTNVTKPTLLYNSVIYPLLNLSIKGMIYYQGESNSRDKRAEYILLFNKMLADWRKDFNQGDLPFYYTQIAPHPEKGEPLTEYYKAVFRETQEMLMSIPHTGMAVALDVGEEKTVHPSDKRSVGERLAKWSLNKTYNLSNVQYLGPKFAKSVIKGNNIILYYDNMSLGKGLSTKDGQAPRGFFVAGADKKFYPAEAHIIGNTIQLSNYNIAKPEAIRYGFTNWIGANLQNKAGLPALQFRTDKWE